MSTSGGTLHASHDVRADQPRQASAARLPLVVHTLALGTFLMGTTEFVVAGRLPEIAGDLQISVGRTGLMITVFVIGMIVGAPLMAMLTLRLPKRLTLMLALGVFRWRMREGYSLLRRSFVRTGRGDVSCAARLLTDLIGWMTARASVSQITDPPGWAESVVSRRLRES